MAIDVKVKMSGIFWEKLSEREPEHAGYYLVYYPADTETYDRPDTYSMGWWNDSEFVESCFRMGDEVPLMWLPIPPVPQSQPEGFLVGVTQEEIDEAVSESPQSSIGHATIMSFKGEVDFD